jgi:acyl carrier protein
VARVVPAADDAGKLLLKVVSERTGYPEEMLGLDQDMEADLGIDSIKRVEIFGALRDLSGDSALSGEGDMEAIAKLKTLRDVLAFLAAKGGPASAPSVSASSGSPALRALLRTASTVEQTPGQSLTLRLGLDLSEHKYLRDHSLYFHSSERDNQGDQILVMPLTGSIELMCEAASLLQPGEKVTGVGKVQALRRLSTVENQPPTEVDVTAKRLGPAEIAVSVRGAGQGGSVLSSCVVKLGTEYAPAPAPVDLSLVNPRVPMCTGKDIYTTHRMFHGPSFQGIHTIDSIGENGLLATLEILPNDNLVASKPGPEYYIDPHLLDAAGQLVGYWPVEYLSEGNMVLPIKITEVAKFCDNPPAGSITSCRLRIREVTQRTLVAANDRRLALSESRLLQ